MMLNDVICWGGKQLQHISNIWFNKTLLATRNSATDYSRGCYYGYEHGYVIEDRLARTLIPNDVERGGGRVGANVFNFIASWIHSYFDNVMTQFIAYNRTDAWKTGINLLIEANAELKPFAWAFTMTVIFLKV